jgi:hypothetical protein
MTAYINRNISDFLHTPDQTLLAELHTAYAADGFVSQYTSQSQAWEVSISLLKKELSYALDTHPSASSWVILLELPLYRLRRRIDLVVVAPYAIAVIELKVGADNFISTDKRQVEEYALDLRDFHEFSRDIPIVPALWCTEATPQLSYLQPLQPGVAEPVVEIGGGQLGQWLVAFGQRGSSLPSIVRENWGQGAYRPVPSVIEAATSLFSGHGVEEIAQADAANLNDAAETVVSLIRRSREEKMRSLIFLTGVPGSGKTLAGLQVVHQVVNTDDRNDGDVVYLSGNTPLVTVLREALTEDEHARRNQSGEKVKKEDIRLSVRARIQHIMDFLKEYVSDEEEKPPHERAIVFDEAQRAWDASYGKQKFGRSASEPSILLDIMSRHEDWSVIIGLIGGGQEINSGENGMAEWGDALRALPPARRSEWTIYGPPGISNGDQATAFIGLGDLQEIPIHEENNLTLTVPLRSYRSPLIAEWVSAVLDARKEDALALTDRIEDFPIVLTRDSATAQTWLQEQARGERRYGLVASSSASRLRAEGFGVSLNATAGRDIAYWYLAPRSDVRSSYALEITANEYTTQGLELDFVGLCWGGDLTMAVNRWVTRRFSGTTWQTAKNDRRRFILNSYRVLLTRAREGLVIWVPRGSVDDPTRDPDAYDRTASFLIACGAQHLDY